MILTASRNDQRPPRAGIKNPNFNQTTDYIGSKKGAPDTPQGFLVEQNPHGVLGAHFHDVHQFQVVARGSGTLGRHPLQPFAVHYTSPESAYGPIVAGADGLWYITLRARTSQVVAFTDQPGVKEGMRRGLKKKQISTPPPVVSDASALLARRDVAVEVMIEPQPDGLATWLLRVPPNGTASAPSHAPGAGRFYVVAAGNLRVEHKDHPPLSLVWVSAEDEPFKVQAGPEGLEVLVTQFPEETAAA